MDVRKVEKKDVTRVDVTAVTMEILLVVKRADTKEDRMAEM